MCYVFVLRRVYASKRIKNAKKMLNFKFFTNFIQFEEFPLLGSVYVASNYRNAAHNCLLHKRVSIFQTWKCCFYEGEVLVLRLLYDILIAI